jgi:GNAT superfamily N-acetyltransferase
MPLDETPFIREKDGYIVSTAPDRIDLGVVCALLAASYWAPHRSRAVVEASLAHSLCFGLYEKEGGRQVGFARVVTDGATFSWLCDVLIADAERGKGLGTFLVSAVSSHPVMQGTTALLLTRDAHGLYEKFGFARAECMLRRTAGGAPIPAPETSPVD